jgi:inhibitor of cysteine peptidase
MKMGHPVTLIVLVSATLLSSHPALAQFSQQGPKLVGTGAGAIASQGDSVSLSADGNTAIVGGPADNSLAGAAWVFTASSPAGSWVLPSSAFRGGVNGAEFHTDVRILNLGTSAVTVLATLYDQASGTTVSASGFPVSGRSQASFDNVLQSLFGKTLASGSYGPIRFDSTGPIIVSSSVNNVNACGTGATSGQWLPGINATNAMTAGLIAQLAVSKSTSAGYRTNLVVMNPGSANATATVRMRAGNGVLLSSGTIGPLGANGFSQVPLDSAGTFPGVARRTDTNLWVEFTSDQPVLAFASVINNASGDPFAVVATPDAGGGASGSWVLPSSAFRGGVNGAEFHTDVRILNLGTSAVTVIATLYDQASGTTVSASGFPVAGRSQASFDNVLQSLFGKTLANGSYGPIRFDSTGSITVSSSVNNVNACGTGATSGQWLPGINATNAMTAGLIAQLAVSTSTSAGYRTNLVVMNPGSANATATVKVRAGGGVLLSSGTIGPLGANGFSQVPLDSAGTFPGVAGRTDTNLWVEFTSDQPVLAFASVINNASGDPFAVVATPDATAIPVSHSLSGAVSGDTLSGVTITVTGTATASATTDSSGNYSVTGVYDGSYTMTPSKTGYTFTPTSLAVTMSGANVTGKNFVAATGASTYIISGTVSGAVLSGVKITLSGAGSTTTTNASGNYSFSGIVNGRYTVTPSMTGFTFSPANSAANVSGANVTVPNFVATAAPGPPAPTGVSASAGNGQATISWNAVSGATSYNIYWSTTSGVTKTSGTKITGAASPYSHTGLINGTTYYYIVTAVNSFGESSESSQVSATPTTGSGLIPTISSLSTNSAAPMSQLTITGAGFDPTATLTVSFFDNTGFKLDVPVLEADSTSINVAVPPYISPSTGMFGPGTVNVQVIQNSDGSIVTSNTIQNFKLQDLPTSNAPSGAVTLDLLNGIIDYYIQLQIVLKNTILDIPELNTAIANNIVKLQALAAQIHTVAQDPSASFSLGSVNGNNVSVGTHALLATDRMIIGLFKTLSVTNSSLTAVTETMDKTRSMETIAPQTTIPCQQEAQDYLDNLTNCNGLGECSSNGKKYDRYAGCSSGGLPVAVKIMNNVIAGAGTVATAVMGLFGAPAIALALPTAVLLNVEAMSIVIQIDVAAAQKNIDEAESYKQMREALDRTEENLRGLIVGKIIPETEGNLKDFYSGLESLYQEFGKTATLVPPPTCTFFTYSAWSACQPGNTQTRTVISSTPAGCTGGEPILSQSCEYGVPPTCTFFTYSAWSACQPDNTQTRTVISSTPAGCTGGVPILSQSCEYGVTGAWSGTVNNPNLGYSGCEGGTTSVSISLTEEASMNINGTAFGGVTLSGSRSGNTITITENTRFGSRGPYLWTWNGSDTITGSVASFCYSLDTGALITEGSGTFSVTRY